MGPKPDDQFLFPRVYPFAPEIAMHSFASLPMQLILQIPKQFSVILPGRHLQWARNVALVGIVARNWFLSVLSAPFFLTRTPRTRKVAVFARFLLVNIQDENRRSEYFQFFPVEIPSFRLARGTPCLLVWSLQTTSLGFSNHTRRIGCRNSRCIQFLACIGN